MIKILSFTSIPCYDILRNSERLKHFEAPSNNLVKIIGKGEKQNPYVVRISFLLLNLLLAGSNILLKYALMCNIRSF